MPTELGVAYLTILPETGKLKKQIAAALDESGGSADKAGKDAGKRYGGGLAGGIKGAVAKAGGVFSALAVGKVGVDAVNLEATFSRTMATMGVTAKVPADQLKGLSDLAIKMGADTVFSASEAADAMLELAKGGLSTATIKAGGLEGTLGLAAASGLDLETAATIASNALNTFGLKGTDVAMVADNLQGAADASSASVGSLAEALSQVGPGATNAGLDLAETVATLSAFDAAGIKGSDAGTSLKTMLARLVPQTDKAKGAMEDLGLKFTDANGAFLPITNVAEQLQKKLGPLSEAQRTTALTTIFGSDATRAATVLMKQGGKGLQGFITKTRESGGAAKVAAARMGGTAGAIEQFKGSVETAKLQLGQFLAPYIQSGLKKLTDGINQIVPAVKYMALFFRDNWTAIKALVIVWASLVVVTKAHGVAMAAADVGGYAAGFLKWAKNLKIVNTVTKTAAAVQWAYNKAMAANALTIVILAIVALIVIIAILWKRNEKFRKIVTAAWEGIKKVAWVVFGGIKALIVGAIDFVRNNWKKIIVIVLAPFLLLPALIFRYWDKIKAVFGVAIGAVLGALKASWNFLSGIIMGPLNAVIGFLSSVWGVVSTILALPIAIARAAISATLTTIRTAFIAIKDWVVNVFGVAWAAVRGALVGPINAAKGAIATAFGAVRNAFTAAKNWVVTVFTAAWNKVKDTIAGPVRAAGNLVATAWTNVKSNFTKAKDWVFNTFAKAWDKLKDMIAGPITKARDVVGGALDKLTGLFRTAVDTIGKVWGTIVDLIKVPIKFILETVINNGLIAGFNKLARKFHTDELSPVDIPAGLARGGVVPGRASSTDNMIALAPFGAMGVASGEYLVNARQTAANRSQLDAINAGRGPVGQPSVNLTVNYPLPEKVSVALPRLLRSAASQLVTA